MITAFSYVYILTTDLQVFSHGAHSPSGTYPNDPYKEEDWPQGYGQLNWVRLNCLKFKCV